MAQLPAGANRISDPADAPSGSVVRPRIGTDCHASDRPVTKLEQAIYWFKKGMQNTYEQDLVVQYLESLEARVAALDTQPTEAAA